MCGYGPLAGLKVKDVLTPEDFLEVLFEINQQGKREMKVCVEVHENLIKFENGCKPFCEYTMNHNNPAERRVLGEQCRNAFEAGQVIVTYPENAKDI